MVRLAPLALLLLFTAAAFAQKRPSFSIQPGGVVAAAMPASVLEEESVRKRLSSGLTTTFLVKARHASHLGGARLEVRYDLWDEAWVVTRVDYQRVIQRDRLSSREALEAWWRAPLRILATSEPRISLRLELDVLPFSAAEEDDARAWISKSGGVGTAGGGGGALVNALIGTTLNAKPVTSFRWNVELSLR